MFTTYPVRCIGRRTIPLGPFAGRKGVLIFLTNPEDAWAQMLTPGQIADVVHDVLLSQDLSGAVYVVIVADEPQQQSAGLLAVTLMDITRVISAWVAPAQPGKASHCDGPALGGRWSEVL